MPKFRKKSVVVEAAQFLATRESFEKIMVLGDLDWSAGEMGSETFFIKTLEGDMLVNKGDYVIKGVGGEFYPCKPDIFEKTYEKVAD